MAKVKRKPVSVVPDYRGFLRDELIEYRDAIVARNGPESFLLQNPTFLRIDALDAGEAVIVRGAEIAAISPLGLLSPDEHYTIDADNAIGAQSLGVAGS